MKKALPITIGLAVVAAIVYALWPKPVPVDFESVARGPMEVTVDEEGKTRIKERYVVSAPLAGRLRRIALKAGDPVEAGKTVVAVIEPSDPALLDARGLAEAVARVKAAEATAAQAVPNLERAKAALEFAQSDHRRVRQLRERGGSTQQDEENAELQVRTHSEELKAAQFAEQIANYELELARAALVRSRTDGDSASEPTNFEIRAPIDGRVLRVREESAGVVTPGTELITLGDPRDLEVEVDVLSSDSVAIKPGAPVRFEHWGGEQPLLGRVRLIEPAGFTKVSALGVEEQRVWVLADFVDPPAKREALGDGYRVEARIIVWHSDDVLKVPASALFRQGDEWAVFRDVDGHARLTGIKIGHNNGIEAEVLDGLAEGDVVIAHPSDKVVDGIRVRQR
jgi:HlyD family secretion protein